jgi:hypothetical protein
MERAVTLSAPESPVHGYSRETVDEFVTAAATEEASLEAVIEEAEARTRKARAAIGTHRVMVAMLLETQHQLDDIRTAAESEAASIMAQAEREADELGSSAPARVLDLTSAEVAPPPEYRPGPPAAPAATDGWSHEGSEGSEYFEFLRGALVDDEPIGPRGE